MRCHLAQLMIGAIGAKFDDAMYGMDRHDSINPEFRRLLNHPVHLVTFEQCLSENKRWAGSSRGRGRLENAADQLFCSDLHDLSAIAGAAVVGDGELLLPDAGEGSHAGDGAGDQ